MKEFLFSAFAISLAFLLSGNLAGLNFILPLVIVWSLFFHWPNSLILAFAGGILLDFLSPFNFGLNLGLMLLTAGSIHYLLVNYLTNRSLYSFTLVTLLATVGYYLLLVLAANLAWALGLSALPLSFSYFNWRLIFWQTAFNLLLIYLIFKFFPPVAKQSPLTL